MLKRSREYLSKLVHTMAHDLRASLHNIVAYAELLRDEHNPMYVEKIVQLALKQSELVTRSVELLDTGLLVDIKDEIDLDELTKSLAKEILPEGIEYHQEFLPRIIGDIQRVRQVFINLFDRAVHDRETTRIEVRLRELDSSIEILVCNDGEETLAGEFKKGMKLESVLALVECIVNAHGWSAKVETDDMDCFCIQIPKNE